MANNEYLNVACNACLSAGEVLLKYWGKLEAIEYKTSMSDLVTQADRESEKVIVEILQKAFPTHSILGEEGGLHDINKSPFLWVVDPLDGTTNYTHQYPMVAVSIALMQEGQSIVGAVYNPINKELYTATKDGGAYLNNHRLHVSRTTLLEKSLLATGFAYDRKKTPETNYTEFTYFTHLTQGVRRGGSAALDLAYVASGRLDGYWEPKLQPWDIAAGSLLVTEAGGRVSSYDLSPLDLYAGKILSSNGLLHEAISRELVKLQRDHSP